jgi:hypothetical protein
MGGDHGGKGGLGGGDDDHGGKSGFGCSESDQLAMEVKVGSVAATLTMEAKAPSGSSADNGGEGNLRQRQIVCCKTGS